LWSVDYLQRVLGATNVRGIVIHPAMVYERDGGVFASFCDDIASTGRVRIIGHEGVRWPLVHCRDIGTLYAVAMAQRAGLALPPLIRSADKAAAQLGEWARGYSIDQPMSGVKARRDLGWKPAHTDPLADVS
jgi:nucleoside-diphosphate-sugar epimerase